MLLKSFMPIFLIVGILSVFGEIQQNKPDTTKQIFTIQVASFPEISKLKAYRLYKQLKEESQFVYTRKGQIGNSDWYRVRVGKFISRDAAGQYRDAKLIHKYPDALIMADSILVQEVNGYEVICTLNDIWIQTDTLFQSLTQFPIPDKLNAYSEFDSRKIFVTPKEKQVYIAYEQGIGKIAILDSSIEESQTAQYIDLISNTQLKPFEVFTPNFSVDAGYIYYQIALYDSSYEKVQSIRNEKINISNSKKTDESNIEKKMINPHVEKVDSLKSSVKVKKSIEKVTDVEKKEENPLEDFLM